MRRTTTTAMLVVALAGLGAVGAGTVWAKQGADDPAGHVRGGNGADDRGADDRRARTAHRGRGRDDKRVDDRRHRGRGLDDRPGDDRGGRGSDD